MSIADNPVLLGLENLHSKITRKNTGFQYPPKKSANESAIRERGSVGDIDLSPAELSRISNVKSPWSRKNISAFFRLKWLRLADAYGDDDRKAFLDEQTNVGLLAGLILSVSTNGMFVDLGSTSASPLRDWLDECDSHTWLIFTNSLFWGSSTCMLLLATVAAVVIGLAGAETNTEVEFHHFEGLLGRLTRLPAVLLMFGTFFLILAIVSYHALVYCSHWKFLLACGGGLGAGLLALPVVIHASLKASWALHIVHGTTPLVEQKKAKSDITAQDIYDALVQYCRERGNNLGMINRREFLGQFESVLSPTMFGLAEKIWNTWMRNQEQAILDELFESHMYPAEGETDKASIVNPIENAI